MIHQFIFETREILQRFQMFSGTLKAENMYKKNLYMVFRAFFRFAKKSHDLAQDAYCSEIIQCSSLNLLTTNGSSH